MPKIKTHKGMMKRIRISKTGLVRHNKAGRKHLRSSKSPKRLRRLRKSSVMSTAEVKRISRMVMVRIRGREQPRTALKRSPTPAERKAKRDAARAKAGKTAAKK
ncbi:MAG: 50S ribosomal protein L35 [Phycisphaerales bacterium]|nr:50S ribosomal protein L35 [Phycisphaerales bacterium]